MCNCIRITQYDKEKGWKSWHKEVSDKKSREGIRRWSVVVAVVHRCISFSRSRSFSRSLPLCHAIFLSATWQSRSLSFSRAPPFSQYMSVVFMHVSVSVCRSIGSTTAIFILIETAATEIIGDNDVCDCVEHELNVVGISSASHVAVDLLSGWLVSRLELRLDVRGCFTVLLRPCGQTDTFPYYSFNLLA